MVKLVSAKCPNCGANLKLSKEEEKVICEYCHNTIIVDDAIACYKLKVSGIVSVEGIITNSELIEVANELLNMNEYLKAKRKFLEFSEKCPDNYQGWLGLLICRTRNFTIKDNNIMFENDVNKFYEHFLRVAPNDIKEQYINIIENYLHPETQRLANSTQNSVSQKNEKIVSTNSQKNDKTWLWVLGWIFCFPIPLTVLIWKSKYSQTVKIILTIVLWGFILIVGSSSESDTVNTTDNSQNQSVVIENENN